MQYSAQHENGNGLDYIGLFGVFKVTRKILPQVLLSTQILYAIKSKNKLKYRCNRFKFY